MTIETTIEDYESKVGALPPNDSDTPYDVIITDGENLKPLGSEEDGYATSGLALTINAIGRFVSISFSAAEATTTVLTSCFKGCERLVSCDMSGLDCSSVTKGNMMFSDCAVLKSADISRMTSLTTVAGMFYGCKALESLDFRGLGGLSGTSNFLAGCTALKNVTVSVNNIGLLKTAPVNTKDTPYSVTLADCGNLYAGFGQTVYDTARYVDLTAAPDTYEGDTLEKRFCATTGTFASNIFITSCDISALECAAVKTATSCFRYCSNMTRVNLPRLDALATATEMFTNCNALEDVRCPPSFPALTVAVSMFEHCLSLGTDGLSRTSFPALLTGDSMFKDTQFDNAAVAALPKFPKLLSAGSMFENSQSVYVKFTDFGRPLKDFSPKLQLANDMFRRQGLEALDASGLTDLTDSILIEGDTISALSFAGCSSITRFGDTKSGSYSPMTSLRSLDLTGCTGLTSIKINNDASLSDVSIAGCTSLSYISAEGTSEALCASLLEQSKAHARESLKSLVLGPTGGDIDLRGMTSLKNLMLYGPVTALNASGCPLTSISFYGKDGSRSASELESIDISGSSLYPGTIEYDILGLAPNLKSFSARNLQFIGGAGTVNFNVCTSLEKIDFSGSFINLDIFTGFNQCPRLTDVSGAFEGCTFTTSDSQKTLSLNFYGQISLPYARTMKGAFKNAGFFNLDEWSLSGWPTNAEDVSECFSGCGRLTQVPALPSGSMALDGCFAGCGMLQSSPSVGSAAVSMKGTFSGCTRIESAPIIPATVTDMEECFSGCTSLESVPNVPRAARNLRECFNGCSSLTEISDWQVNAAGAVMTGCFTGCSALSKVGTKVPVLAESTKWRLLRLSGTRLSVWGADGASEGGAELESASGTLALRGKTAELALRNGPFTDEEVSDFISSGYHYGLTGLNPNGKNFALWKSEDSELKTNLPFGGSGAGMRVFDTQADADDALPGLAEGQVVATLEDGDLTALKETYRVLLAELRAARPVTLSDVPPAATRYRYTATTSGMDWSEYEYVAISVGWSGNNLGSLAASPIVMRLKDMLDHNNAVAANPPTVVDNNTGTSRAATRPYIGTAYRDSYMNWLSGTPDNVTVNIVTDHMLCVPFNIGQEA